MHSATEASGFERNFCGCREYPQYTADDKVGFALMLTSGNDSMDAAEVLHTGREILTKHHLNLLSQIVDLCMANCPLHDVGTDFFSGNAIDLQSLIAPHLRCGAVAAS